MALTCWRFDSISDIGFIHSVRPKQSQNTTLSEVIIHDSDPFSGQFGISCVKEILDELGKKQKWNIVNHTWNHIYMNECGFFLERNITWILLCLIAIYIPMWWNITLFTFKFHVIRSIRMTSLVPLKWKAWTESCWLLHVNELRYRLQCIALDVIAWPGRRNMLHNSIVTGVQLCFELSMLDMQWYVQLHTKSMCYTTLYSVKTN